MRVAILTSVFSREYGVPRVIAAQLPWLLSAGIQVDIYACETRDPVDTGAARLIRVPTHLHGLRQALHSGNYDVVMAHTHPFFHLLPRLHDVKTLLYEHGMPPAERFPSGEREKRIQTVADMTAFVYPAVDQVVTISQYAARYIGWEQAIVLYNGADHFGSAAMTQERLPGPVRVLCVSRFGTGELCYKGIDLLVRLAGDLGAGFRVVLLGRGPAAEKARLQNQGLTVVDYVDDRQLCKEYAACDLLVSLSQWETFNLPLGEAGFFHKPAYALDLGPHREVTPFVFEGYEALRDHLRAVTPDSLRKEGERMFAHVDAHFRWEYNGHALVRLLKDMVPFPHKATPGLCQRGWWFFWALREKVRQFVKAWRGHGCST